MRKPIHKQQKDKNIKNSYSGKFAILLLSIFICTINICCFLTTGYQNARMIGRGKIQIIPDVSGAYGAYDAGVGEKDFCLSSGAQVVWGLTDKFNLGTRAAYYSSLTYDLRNGPFLGLIPKIRLKEDNLALAFPTYFYYMGGYPGEQFDIRLIYSWFFMENTDITITPLVSLTISGGYVTLGLGTNIGCGIPLGQLPVWLRPEIGIMTLANNDWIPIISYGIALDIRPYMKSLSK